MGVALRVPAILCPAGAPEPDLSGFVRPVRVPVWIFKCNRPRGHDIALLDRAAVAPPQAAWNPLASNTEGLILAGGESEVTSKTAPGFLASPQDGSPVLVITNTDMTQAEKNATQRGIVLRWNGRGYTPR